MPPDTPPLLVLLASHSALERDLVRQMVGAAVGDIVELEDAQQAVKELVRGPDRPAVLVIDSGLLVAHHDSQWRDLCADHPGLRTVVRTLLPREAGVRRGRDGSWLVHPGDDEGTLQAVREAARARASA